MLKFMQLHVSLGNLQKIEQIQKYELVSALEEQRGGIDCRILIENIRRFV